MHENPEHFTIIDLPLEARENTIFSSCKSILIPVLLYGWEDNNVVEEEDTDDGNNIAGETPS